MKVYIQNFNLDIIEEVSGMFKNCLTHTDTYITLYTDEGMYQIEDKQIYLLDTVDKDSITYANFYNEFTLIVDPSFFSKVCFRKGAYIVSNKARNLQGRCVINCYACNSLSFMRRNSEPVRYLF